MPISGKPTSRYRKGGPKWPVVLAMPRAEFDKYGAGVNWGLSWVGLEEFVELDWDQQLRYHAYVKEQYQDFRPDQPFPDLFPKTVNLYNGQCGPPPENTKEVEWTISLRDYVGCSEWFIAQLKSLAEGDELRVIYWFDD